MQFSNLGSLEHHGFARNKLWTLDPNPPPFPTNSSSRAFTDLILKNSEDDSKNWPHRYTYIPLHELNILFLSIACVLYFGRVFYHYFLQI